MVNNHPLVSVTVAANGKDKCNPASLKWLSAHNWSIEQLFKHLTNGFPVAVGVYNPPEQPVRRKDQFVSSQIIGLDFDKLSPKSAQDLTAHPFVRHYAAFIYSTPSHKPNAPRLRLFFVLDESVTSVQQYEQAVSAMIVKFRDFAPDPACKDAARFFYGSSTPDSEFTLFFGNLLPIGVIANVSDLYRPTNKAKKTDETPLSSYAAKNVEQRLQFTGRTNGDFLECHCPIHPPDKNPSAGWNPEKQILYCFHDGKTYLAKDVAAYLGITFILQTGQPNPSIEGESPVSIAGLTINEIFPNLDFETVIDCLNLNEYGDAILLMKLVQDRIVFDHAEKSWFWWSGNVWMKDRQKKTPELLYAPVGELYATTANSIEKQIAELSGQDNQDEATTLKLENLKKQLVKRSHDLRSHHRSNHVLSIASGLHGLSGSEWDANPRLLGVKNGVIDLRTGAFSEGRLDDYIRKVANVDFEPKAKAPRWESFIAEIFNNDELIAKFVQRLLGYCITGITSDHVLPIFFGRGRNGKDTLIETVGHVLGDYASSSTSDLLIEQTAFAGQAQPHIYNLLGKRLVWVTETRDGSKLNVNQVKYLTGAGRMFARPLYGNPIEFETTHHIILFTNHKPRVPSESEDYAIWKRLLLIPLTLSFVKNPKAPHERQSDSRLKERLFSEAKGILNWLVQGCLAWQQEGLNPPESIIQATHEYAHSEDIIGQFIEARCILHPHAEIGASHIYNAYEEWAKSNGYPVITLRKFGERLHQQFEKKRDARQVKYIGIALQDDL